MRVAFYEYTPAGEFLPIADPIAAGTGATEYHAVMREAGWVQERTFGATDTVFEVIVFERIADNDGAKLVDLSDQQGTIWCCQVPAAAWPRFFRVELLPYIKTNLAGRSWEELARIAQDLEDKLQ